MPRATLHPSPPTLWMPRATPHPSLPTLWMPPATLHPSPPTLWIHRRWLKHVHRWLRRLQLQHRPGGFLTHCSRNDSCRHSRIDSHRHSRINSCRHSRINSCRHQCRHQSWVHGSRQPTLLAQLDAVKLSICPAQPKPARAGDYGPAADGLQLASRPEEGLEGQVGAGEGDAGVADGRWNARRRSAGEGERRRWIRGKLVGRC